MFKSRRLKKANIALTHEISEKTADLNNFYPFVPKELLNILSGRQLSNFMPNMQREITAALVNVNTADFFSLLHTTETEKTFQIINHVLAEVVPEVSKSEGIIDKFIEAGFTAFYPEDANETERALAMAVSMCEKVCEMDDPNSYYKDFCIGITYGRLILGTVGYEGRLAAVALSEDAGFNEFLRKKAGKYYSKILITQKAAMRIPDFNKNFSSRKLGYFHIKTTGEDELIYDVYESDSIPIKAIKRKTKLLFEKGTELFFNKNYSDARLHFVEVLKANRWDAAAKEYLLMCDKYSDEAQNETHIYIERY